MVSGLCARGPEEKFALILPFLSPILLYLLRILQFSPVFSAFSLRFKLLGNAKEASPQQFGANFLRHMVTLIFRLQAWAWLASISSSGSNGPNTVKSRRQVWPKCLRKSPNRIVGSPFGPPHHYLRIVQHCQGDMACMSAVCPGDCWRVSECLSIIYHLAPIHSWPSIVKLSVWLIATLQMSN